MDDLYMLEAALPKLIEEIIEEEIVKKPNYRRIQIENVESGIRKRHPAIILISHNSNLDLLHPKYRLLRQKIIKYGNDLHIFTKGLADFMYRFEKARAFSASGLLNKLYKLPKEARQYVMTGLKFCGFKFRPLKKPNFVLSNVFNSMTLYKLCGKQYKLLAFLFGLPPPNMVKDIIDSVPFYKGKCELMLGCLKRNVPFILYQTNFEEVMEIKKGWFVCCSLQWDIIPLNSNKKLAFETASKEKTIKDCMLVFMIRGIISQWKQVVAYFPVKEMNSCELKKIIYEITINVSRQKVRVLTTICTPSLINQEALEMLVNETKEKRPKHANFSFFMDDYEVFILYDPPSLLKELRDLFQKYDIRHGLKGNQKDASFRDIKAYYKKIVPSLREDDESGNNYYKVWEDHLNPKRVQKKRTFMAIQLFSQHIGSNLSICFGNVEKLIPNAINTGALILYFNKLFDSLNGRETAARDLNAKGVRDVPLTPSCEHVNYWKNEKKKLKGMKFINRKTGEVVASNHFDNWFKTITNFGQIWNIARCETARIYTSNFNLEPLHNFISAIYSMNNGRIYLTKQDVVEIIRILVITSFRPPYFRQTICLSDRCEAVCNLHMYFNDQSLIRYNPRQVIHPNKFMFLVSDGLYCHSRTRHDFNYYHLAAYIAYKLANKYRHCKTCFSFFTRCLKQKRKTTQGLTTIRKVSKHLVANIAEICSLNLLINFENFDSFVFKQWYARYTSMLNLDCAEHEKEVQLKFYEMVVCCFVKSTMKFANILAISYDTRCRKRKTPVVNKFVLQLLAELKKELDETEFRRGGEEEEDTTTDDGSRESEEDRLLKPQFIQ